MSFVQPIWDPANGHYVIDLLKKDIHVTINKDVSGNTIFSNTDKVENITHDIIHALIEEGSNGNWFSKLPSHDQLVKRVKHTFKNLANLSDNSAELKTLLLTPKQITFLWNPTTYTNPLQISFDESESDGDQIEISESDLPPVRLTDDSEENQEEYLLTRLRAAKARVEAEQIRMEYFQATGRMPPDSESEDE